MPTTNNGDRQRAVTHFAEAHACLRQLKKGLEQCHEHASEPAEREQLADQIKLVEAISGNTSSLQAELAEKLRGRLPESYGDMKPQEAQP